ncbi:MAG: aminotransferase class V-fold PLP-dependent enzyme [Candidatus Heimdallarchaeota archaeon]|nr:aminotransferase class V-fold PLP-dependent enzyme [Candidatus Heimdallarchaeota archaeon]
MFDQELIQKIRAEFPRASKDLNGRERAFFDNGTGSLVLERAAKKEAESRIDCSANIGAIFDESLKAEETIAAGRQAVADFLNAPSSETIISGESATKLFFDVSYALGKELKGTENIVTTELEHYANVSQWLELVWRGKIKEVRFARLKKEDGTLDFNHLQELIDSNTKVVTVTAASNMVGTKLPLKKISKLAQEVEAYYLVDAVHHAPHGPIDVQAIDCDFLNFSMYKLFGPHGSFMYAKEEHIGNLTPFKVKPSKNYGPFKWESGTRNQAMFAAICGVMDHFLWLAEKIKPKFAGQLIEFKDVKRDLKITMYGIEKYLQELSKVVLEGFDDVPGLLNIPNVKVYGLTSINRLVERDPTFSFAVDNIPHKEVNERLWKEGGIAMRAGNFYSYAQEVYNQLEILRFSLVHYNTIDEIRVFLTTLNSICSKI